MPFSRVADPGFFVPERVFTTSNLAEAIAACEDEFRYQKPEIRLDQLFLDEDLGLSFNDQRYGCTEAAFNDLCRLLDLPERFAKSIPTDLVSTIVGRLKELHQQTVIPIYRDNTAVGIVDPLKWTHHNRGRGRKPFYDPVTHLDLLHMLQEFWKEDEVASLKITVSDTGMQLELVYRNLTVEPTAGDITQVGLAITSSETGGPMPQARGYTLRLVCTNGALLPENLGLVRFSTDWRVRMERRMLTFASALESLHPNLDQLHQGYHQLAHDSVTDHLFYTLFRRAEHIFRRAAWWGTESSAEIADRVLGVPADTRREIVTRVRERQAQQRQSFFAPIPAPQPTGLQAWDIFNHITAAARSEPYDRRVALERLGGDVLGAYLPSAHPN